MGNNKQKAVMPMLTDEISLCNELYSKCCHEELKEIDKHEIIIKICDAIGSTPNKLCKAEEIFNDIKYDITKYVLHHEYCFESRNQVKPEFLLWLDTKAEPVKAKELSQFLDRYLK